MLILVSQKNQTIHTISINSLTSLKTLNTTVEPETFVWEIKHWFLGTIQILLAWPSSDSTESLFPLIPPYNIQQYTSSILWINSCTTSKHYYDIHGERSQNPSFRNNFSSFLAKQGKYNLTVISLNQAKSSQNDIWLHFRGSKVEPVLRWAFYFSNLLSNMSH